VPPRRTSLLRPLSLLRPPQGRGLNGGRDKLTDEERAFVGVGASRRREGLGGWHQPETAPYELDSILSAEDTEVLQPLMMIGHADRVEFMG
jgi:hypothetical protein